MSAPDWLTVGARVASVRSVDYGRTQEVKFAHVDRIGKRDVVLDDGERFNVTRLTRSEGSWGATTALMDANDPRVAMFVEQQRVRRARTSAIYAGGQFRQGKASAADVILALAPLTGVEAEIRALFNEARP